MDKLYSQDLGDILSVLEAENNNVLDFDSLNMFLELGDVPAHDTHPPSYGYAVTTPGPTGALSSDTTGRRSHVSGAEGASVRVPVLMKHESFSGEAHAGETSDQTRGGVPANGGFNSTLDAEAAVSRPKKKRTRNQEQMQLNRVAQQKYRERKKAEHNELQQAVDQLAAQLAAFKALEVQAQHLELANRDLNITVAQQAQRLGVLELKTAEQAATISGQQAALSEAAAIAAGQQKMILEQHTKLQLQEQVIAALKDRLKASVDSAMANVSEGTVCEKLLAAVKSALYGAKDVEGLQEVLEKLPEHLIVEICRNIFCACKELWPELYQRCAARGGQCGGQPMSAAVVC